MNEKSYIICDTQKCKKINWERLAMELSTKGVLGSLISIIAYCVGGFDEGIKILLLLIVVDYITGVLNSYIKGRLDSKTGAIGILKKMGMFFIITVAVQIETIINQPNSLHVAVVYFYIGNECLSILENVGDYVPIPEFLKKAINKLKDKE